MERLGAVYKNILKLEFSGGAADAPQAPLLSGRVPMELFAEFYAYMNGKNLTEEMARMAAEAFDAAREARGI